MTFASTRLHDHVASMGGPAPRFQFIQDPWSIGSRDHSQHGDTYDHLAAADWSRHRSMRGFDNTANRPRAAEKPIATRRWQGAEAARAGGGNASRVRG